MIDGRRLLADLQPLRKRLEDDLRERSEQVPELTRRLREEWQAARQKERTAQTYEAWREDALAQAAAMWLLACVFVRFLEDNALAEPPRLAAPGARLSLARDQRTLYFQEHPHDSDRDYLYSVFEAVAALPAAAPLLDHRHNPIWQVGISGDAATQVIDFWQRVDPASGALVHDFTDPEWTTRFLGDLYQDLSASARKKYALLQTPDFVLQFILDRTLTPAIAEFGFRDVQMIDPACGSGHFLLAAFERLARLWAQHEPGTNARELAQRALAQVSGVDLNPFAVAIARFRLLLAALRASNITKLVDAPAFNMELAAGDSLLHGPRPGEVASRQLYLDPESDPLAHVYSTEDAVDLRRILGRRYHVVVGNPPYITPKDAVLNKAYRDRFDSCHGLYALTVPFFERFFDAVVPGGFVGKITGSSFATREFGSRLVERYLPKWNITHVVDTDKAHLPGHATGTVVVLARGGAPASDTIRTVIGLRKEEPAPLNAAAGRVWLAIVDQIDVPSTSAYVATGDQPRSRFSSHPWSLSSVETGDLRQKLEAGRPPLATKAQSVGFFLDTHADDAFALPRGFAQRHGLSDAFRRQVRGEDVRDWAYSDGDWMFFPYGANLELWESVPLEPQWSWLHALRTALWSRAVFGGGTYRTAGRKWFEFHQFPRDRARASWLICFAEIATHNNFVPVSKGTVCNRTAPVIELKREITADEFAGIVATLNSSIACFWLRQVCHDKGAGGIGGGVSAEEWEHRHAFNASNVQQMPIPAQLPIPHARLLMTSAAQFAESAPAASIRTNEANWTSRAEVAEARGTWEQRLGRLISLQEECDWQLYSTYGLVEEDICCTLDTVPEIQLGERAFEIAMARKIAARQLDTAWFERHRAMPVTEVPAHWPEAYRRVVERRLLLIEDNSEIALVEQPAYKRRWNVDRWEDLAERALREWLLDRLESVSYWPNVALTSAARLADHARHDAEFLRKAAIYRDRDEFDVSTLVAELLESESVPFLSVLRYKAAGLEKRAQWESVWALQRREDAHESVGEIMGPPEYASSDFANTVYWRLRGKLDVPKERFVSYPHCQRDSDSTPVISWAGWDHLQQARALGTYYVQMKESEGWSRDRLTPLLAGLMELLPWLLQWHNEVDPEYGQRMGDYYEGFVDEEARALGLTREAIRVWTPPTAARRRGRRAQPTEQ
ncbi:BREX-2 system adenine-specific DNA-methyltransferase PglX [Luteitalea sp.]|uniref:BREX-2 system adenine-specific DNA-methyltransferase PglX n=1 Tax=Luteitalea sp. TaxID=2004800 RepID=UPI0025BCBACF|nr:BREX-2 system adenine-specific DNA-methyltransferase PglX [Luteitalea sp.]